MNNFKTVAFYTLGCKLNFAETSTITRLFIDNNFKKVSFKSKADVYIINSCCVTEAAEKKSRNIINRAISQNPDAIIVVTGCYAQLQFEKISKIKGVDLILGNDEKFNIIKHIANNDKSKIPQVFINNSEILNTFYSSFSIDERTRSFLKVQDGCDYKCSYCTVPKVRGNSRNADIQTITEQANIIAKKGIKEIILTGINIGDYGKSTNESFLDLIKKLDDIEGIERFRISSIEPDLLKDNIIQFISDSKKFVPHFHIPLQSGSDSILKLMKRRYNADSFSKKIKSIKNIIPDVAIGIDVIVGFPGETEKEFLETFNLINNLDISYLHIFTFSERPDTEAIKLDKKVLNIEKNRRSKLLHNLSEIKKNQFYRNNLNKIYEVLFESANHIGQMYGFTGNYIKTEIPYNSNYINKIIKVKLQNINDAGNVSAIVIDNKKT